MATRIRKGAWSRFGFYASELMTDAGCRTEVGRHARDAWGLTDALRSRAPDSDDLLVARGWIMTESQ